MTTEVSELILDKICLKAKAFTSHRKLVYSVVTISTMIKKDLIVMIFISKGMSALRGQGMGGNNHLVSFYWRLIMHLKVLLLFSVTVDFTKIVKSCFLIYQLLPKV